MDEEQRRLAEELLFSEKKKESFAKKLFFGEFVASEVFPFPTLNKSEQLRTDAFLEEVQHFVDQHIDPVKIDRQAAIPQKVIEGLGRLGVLGITIPKEYGGLGLSQYAYCKAVEIIARRCGSTALFVNAHQSIGLKALLLFGTRDQRARWLPPLAKGEQLAAFSLTEPNAGSDANGVETRAEFDPVRNIYRINGKKQWTTNGAIAGIITVMAKTTVQTPQGVQDKVTAFLVTPDMPGFVVIDPALDKVGMRGSKTANLEFRNMEVPAAHVLGPLGGGLKVCLTVLDYGRTTFGATCTGAASVLVEDAIRHAKSRFQFKRPLATFALVKQKIANMSALLYAMRATTYLTAGLVDKGKEDIMLESAMLKVFSSDALWSILYDTMQIFGGRSFFTDAPYERMMRDARLNMIGEGSNEVMRAFIGAVGLRDVGVQLKEAASFTSLSALLKLRKQFLNSVKVPVRSPLLKEEASALGKAVHRFGSMVVRALIQHREDIIERQLTLDKLATAAMALYTTTAVLSKLDTDLTAEHGSVDALGDDVAIGKFYCHQAMKTLHNSLDAVFDNNDKETEALADQITGVHYP